MKKTIEGDLFPDFVSEISKSRAESELSVHYQKKRHLDNQHLFHQDQAGYMDFPVLDKYTGTVPKLLVSFDHARTAVTHSGAFVHFYIDDYQFQRVWLNPQNYLDLFRQFEGVLGTDFSQYSNMPYPTRMNNAYKNRLIGRFLQDEGINYIHNVTWSKPDSYEYSFSGIPQQSIIAINCTSILRCDYSKYLWRKGYDEAIRRLDPLKIIRYGTKMPGEKEEISIYFENEQLNLLRNGR